MMLPPQMHHVELLQLSRKIKQHMLLMNASHAPQMHHVELLQLPHEIEQHMQLMNASYVQMNETKKGERHLSRSPIVSTIH